MCTLKSYHTEHYSDVFSGDQWLGNLKLEFYKSVQELFQMHFVCASIIGIENTMLQYMSESTILSNLLNTFESDFRFEGMLGCALLLKGKNLHDIYERLENLCGGHIGQGDIYCNSLTEVLTKDPAISYCTKKVIHYNEYHGHESFCNVVGSLAYAFPCRMDSAYFIKEFHSQELIELVLRKLRDSNINTYTEFTTIIQVLSKQHFVTAEYLQIEIESMLLDSLHLVESYNGELGVLIREQAGRILNE